MKSQSWDFRSGLSAWSALLINGRTQRLRQALSLWEAVVGPWQRRLQSGPSDSESSLRVRLLLTTDLIVNLRLLKISCNFLALSPLLTVRGQASIPGVVFC